MHIENSSRLASVRISSSMPTVAQPIKSSIATVAARSCENRCIPGRTAGGIAAAAAGMTITRAPAPPGGVGGSSAAIRLALQEPDPCS